MYIVTPDEMRYIDGRAIREFGIPGIVLMENAALAVVRVIKEQYGPGKLKRILVLAGTGNNGGDGFAVARHLHLDGYDVETWIVNPEGRKITGDAGTNLEILKKLQGGETTKAPQTLLSDPVMWKRRYGRRIAVLDNNVSGSEINEYLEGTTLIIDALFGTGLARPVSGLFKILIDAVNESGIPVVAVDIPSGINGTTGGVLGTAVRAEHTVTFGYLKRGHLFFPGRQYAGRVHEASIGLPADSAGAAAVQAFTLTDEEVAARLRPRPVDGHKGTFGRVAILAGSTGFTGAAYLTAQSALKSGAGLVTLGIPASLNPIMEVKLTEVMTQPLPDDGGGRLAAEGLDVVLDMLKDKDVLALGPGLGKSSGVFEIIRNIFGRIDISIVVDADGLNNISRDITLIGCHRKPVILTPHPGEMARLTGMTVNGILEDPTEAALSFARQHGCIVLLKGATSVVADPDGRLYINTSGNSGMGTGGTGDCLTGIIAALVGQGYPPFDATVLGCYIHGRAGDMAAGDMGEIGMAAEDLMERIPGVFQMLYKLRTRDPGCRQSQEQ